MYAYTDNFPLQVLAEEEDVPSVKQNVPDTRGILRQFWDHATERRDSFKYLQRGYNCITMGSTLPFIVLL